MTKIRTIPLLGSALAAVLFAAGLSAPLPAGNEGAAAENFNAAAACPPLPPPAGQTVNVSTVSALESAVNNASPGDTILVADGVYALDGVYLRLDTTDVALRSASGDREAVVLDGNYITTEIIQIVASGVTVADLTLREAYNHPIHVMSSESSDTLDTLIYNVHIVDPGEQAVKINPVPGGYYTDDGMIACSHIELTDAGRPFIRNNCYTGGVDAHQSWGWTIRDNRIEGFWCESGLSEHGVHLWTGSRDTIVERNLLLDNARGIGFGLVTSGSGRVYPDDPCPEAGGSYVDHYAGVVRNNFILAQDSGLFSSASGFDCGICLSNACQAKALHNTVYTFEPENTFSAIEWRFPNSIVEISNNLANEAFFERDGASAGQVGNLTNAQAGWFLNPAAADLHLAATASAVIDLAAPIGDVFDDFDGDLRPAGPGPDIGADEYGGVPFEPTAFLHLPVLRTSN
ncbi:MAG TPA: hypothetical protein VJ768_06685 [Anaerolineales bacterium]|nr:hypothetical protein [Anaerolineales bacterium]